jgi:hypothetical protein
MRFDPKFSMLFFLGLLPSCQQPAPKTSGCAHPKELDVYAVNISEPDTVVHARILLDDMVVVNALIPRLRTSSEKLTKSLAVCPGPHRLHVAFGPLQKDSMIALMGDQSLFVSFNYNRGAFKELPSGIVIVVINHDEQWKHRID